MAGAIAGVIACGDTAAPSSGAHRVLFIGNSLSFGVPQTVQAIGQLDHYDMAVGEELAGNTAIIDHYLDGAGPEAIKSAAWDYVVMQQGPTTHSLCYDTLVLSLKDLDPIVRSAGGRSAVWMPWPAATDSAGGGFERVRESFQTAAKAVDGVFLPAGEAWRMAWAQDPTLQLYDVDGYHPSALGTFLVALVVYEGLTGHDARTLPKQALLGNSTNDLVPPATVQILQEAAHGAVEKYGAGSVPGLPPIPVTGPLTC